MDILFIVATGLFGLFLALENEKQKKKTRKVIAQAFECELTEFRYKKIVKNKNVTHYVYYYDKIYQIEFSGDKPVEVVYKKEVAAIPE